MNKLIFIEFYNEELYEKLSRHCYFYLDRPPAAIALHHQVLDVIVSQYIILQKINKPSGKLSLNRTMSCLS